MEETTTTTPETNTASQETTPQETEPAKSAESTPAEKTFTQKELDDIVKQRLDRAKKDMPSKEELKAFREWKDSQKTAEQKAADDIAAANLAKEAAEREKQALEIKVVIRRSPSGKIYPRGIGGKFGSGCKKSVALDVGAAEYQRGHILQGAVMGHIGFVTMPPGMNVIFNATPDRQPQLLRSKGRIYRYDCTVLSPAEAVDSTRLAVCHNKRGDHSLALMINFGIILARLLYAPVCSLISCVPSGIYPCNSSASLASFSSSPAVRFAFSRNFSY